MTTQTTNMILTILKVSDLSQVNPKLLDRVFQLERLCGNLQSKQILAVLIVLLGEQAVIQEKP